MAGLCLAAALLAGCADRADATVPAVGQAPVGSAQSRAGHQLQPDGRLATSRCQQFSPKFQEFTACERADGTLQAFTAHDIDWRVRYFVRYWQMPCNEAPTIEEGYVYHMVTNDLYNDSDLNNKQRVAIRQAMFDGQVECK